ncbi:hypothetical protein DFP72DRAFT_1014981 [Ephemerocybe angulata]|uniref:Heat shock 70 kDa protein 12A n=1 Tax=Ephemerocybe angulata TaxID=980116 RepID=A0A8H6HKC8_9AGAR|nr:hypothetical protein DFP72DRAFT_1014981 [Tulosesus angulatus]
MENAGRKEYEGTTRRLLLAFDIGTTFSGISYSILDPGKVPEIRPVTRYPSQEQVGGDSKIPTVIYYNKHGKPQAIGAETLKEGIEADAEEEEWQVARWFKLHLRPKSAVVAGEEPVPPLPCNKTVTEVFTDFMVYLHNCAKTYITETHGAPLYASLSKDIIYVLTHPNGWAGPQQTAMRQAAINGRLVPNTVEGKARVMFVTEGEASLHFCLSNGLDLSVAKDEEEEEGPPKKKVKLTKAAKAKADAKKEKGGNGVLIVDAGGGTIDVTSYSQQPDGSYTEIAIPECDFQGSAYVTMRAKKWFTNLLKATRFEPDAETLTQRFDRSTKHVFRKEDEPHHIQFASIREKEPALKIRSGRLTMEGTDVASFFKPSVDCIVNAVKKQSAAARVPIRSVFLVGGFSASPWLFSQVQAAIDPLGITVSRPDSHVNKAVSNGAVSFFLDSLVSSRVSRATYGIEVAPTYDSTNREHMKRGLKVKVHPATGLPHLDGGFWAVLRKGVEVKTTQEFIQRDFRLQRQTREALNTYSTKILGYTGDLPNPKWLDEDPDKFAEVCKVEADISTVTASEKKSATGETYYQIEVAIVLLFGLTELKAQIAWKENVSRKFKPSCSMAHTPWYPSQGTAGSDSKIPTVIYYHKNGKLAAIGAETLKEGIEVEVEEEDWQIARWFKLHLRPKSAFVAGEEPVPPLPCGKTVVEVFTDFVFYMHNCAEKFITETHGAVVWASLSKDISYVLTHPNGWAGPQQTAMREAAIKAGLVPDTPEGRARVVFVTEGEASLHFCLSNGMSLAAAKEEEDEPPRKKTKLSKAAAAKTKGATQAKEGDGVLIVDAGGGTVDVTSYCRQPDGSYVEIAIPQCYFQGSAYVTMRAKAWFTNFFKGSRFKDDVDALTHTFDTKTKPRFQKFDEKYHIPFASVRERDPALNVTAGRLKMEGSDIASFFKPSIDCIVNAVKEQSAAAHVPIRSVFMVGGFSASEWLFQQVKAQVEPLGIAVSIPDQHVNKAVASGAVSFFLDSMVSSRVSRAMYGLSIYQEYDSTNPDHVKRGHDVKVHKARGIPILHDYFKVILPKGVQVTATEEFVDHFHREAMDRASLNIQSSQILMYAGESQISSWIQDEPDMYPVVCRIEADLSKITATEGKNSKGETFYRIDFSIVLLFGLTELRAQLAYMEDGVEKRGPASIIFANGAFA